MCYVCAFSLHRESPDIILGDEPLISEVVLSHFTNSRSYFISSRCIRTMNILYFILLHIKHISRCFILHYAKKIFRQSNFSVHHCLIKYR
jgi:hypothetical protein